MHPYPIDRPIQGGSEAPLARMPREVMDRRRFLGVLGGGAAALALAACGTAKPSASGSASTTTAPKSNRPLVFRHPTVSDNLFKQYFGVFQKQYGIPVTLSSVYQNYAPVTETALVGGATFDVMEADPGVLGTWYSAGLVRDLEGMDGLEAILANIYPSAVADLKAPNGKVVGLPYFTEMQGLFYNAKMFQKAGLGPPADWQGLISAARKLKAMGIAPTPFAPKWSPAFHAATIALFTMAFSAGLDHAFDETGKATYDSEPVMEEMLSVMRTLYKEGLVPKDVLTYSSSGAADVFIAGKAAMFQYETYYAATFNKKGSRINGEAKLAPLPGSTHASWAQQATYLMGDKHTDLDRSGKLLKFMSATDKGGKYLVPTQLYAIDLALAVPYKSVVADPAVQAGLSKYMDYKVLEDYLSSAKSMGHVLNTSWFGHWEDKMDVAIGEVVTGSKTASEALKETAVFARAQAKT